MPRFRFELETYGIKARGTTAGVKFLSLFMLRVYLICITDHGSDHVIVYTYVFKVAATNNPTALLKSSMVCETSLSYTARWVYF